MTRKKTLSGRCAGIILMGLLATAALAHGQVVHSAQGAGPSLWVGAEYSNLKAGFPKGSSTRLSGIGVFGDLNWNRRLGIEAHARFLDLGSWHDETQQDYLIGPRYTLLHHEKLRPYAKFEVGLVKIHYPFSLGDTTNFAMAPGGGIEYRLRDKWSLRAAYEYQVLTNSPNFTNEEKYGIHPNGVVAGFSYRLF